MGDVPHVVFFLSFCPFFSFSCSCIYFLKIRVEAVIVMVIHSWVAMVKSISPPPSATAECISLMRCLQPVCRAAAAAVVVVVVVLVC